MKQLVWLVPFFVPLALHGCSAPADADPFAGSDDSEAPTSFMPPSSPAAGSSAAPATGGSSAPSAAPSATPAPAGSGAAAPAGRNEGMGTLPLEPEQDGDTGGSAPEEQTPAPAPAAETPPPAQTPAAPGAPAATPTPPAQTPPQPADVPPVNLAQCVSYESGFLPLVHDPVCSNCHTGNNGLPAFEPFSAALGRCAQIGREVASGSMPPGGGLSAEQRETVALWVGIGCPETDAAAAQICAQAPTNAGNAPNGGNTPPAQAGNDDDDDDDGGGNDDDDDSDDDNGGDDDGGGDDD